ncbi:MAG: EAL domain-containing protein [Nitrospirota bacterium]
MNRLLKRQLKKFLGESYVSDPLFQSDRFRNLLSVIDKAYEHSIMEQRLLERTIDLNSRELNAANTLLKKQNEEISALATVDALTGLANRHAYNHKIDRALKHAKRYDSNFSIMFIDLDRFKIINDSLGHHIGDLILRHVAKRLLSCVRESDTITRMGGDEFTILLEEIQNVNDIASASKKILDELSQPFDCEGHEILITASIGISIYPSDGTDQVSLSKHADTAMYQAKDLGRNNFQFYHPTMSVKALEHMAFESRLRKALDRQEFVLHYQPQLDIETGKITGMEALVRWQSPEFGLVMPSDFIPLAEETGLIIPIGEWVLHSACMQNKVWHNAGLKRIKVAVNVSGRQLQSSSFISTIDSAFKMSCLSPEYLDLELTESSVMHKGKYFTDMLHELKQRGIYLSIDDFGTGYSSLSNLKQFTIDKLKIDQGFIRDIGHNSDASTIIKAVIVMAHSMRLKVIAEGVETVEQLSFLRSKGCDQIQGYIASKPVPPAKMELLLREDKNFLCSHILHHQTNKI